MRVSDHILRLTSDPRITKVLADVKDEAERERLIIAMNGMLSDVVRQFGAFINVEVPPEYVMEEKTGGVIGRVEIGGDDEDGR